MYCLSSNWKPQLPLSLAAWSTTDYWQKSRTTQVVNIAIRYSSPIIEQPISPLCPRPVPHPQLPPNQDQNHWFCSLMTLITNWTFRSMPSSLNQVCLRPRYWASVAIDEDSEDEDDGVIVGDCHKMVRASRGTLRRGEIERVTVGTRSAGDLASRSQGFTWVSLHRGHCS